MVIFLIHTLHIHGRKLKYTGVRFIMDQLQAFHHLSSQVRILYTQSILTFFFPIIFAPALCVLLW
ncbi:MAG: hypothetical protein ACI9XC_000694 [Gammaproteobacteria bacterium]|jgi:hypothetical protein